MLFYCFVFVFHDVVWCGCPSRSLLVFASHLIAFSRFFVVSSWLVGWFWVVSNIVRLSAQNGYFLGWLVSPNHHLSLESREVVVVVAVAFSIFFKGQRVLTTMGKQETDDAQAASVSSRQQQPQRKSANNFAPKLPIQQYSLPIAVDDTIVVYDGNFAFKRCPQ